MNGPLDLSEKGRGGSSLDRRLFVQFLAFGGIDQESESRLVRDLERFPFPTVLYSDINDYRGAGLLAMSETPDFFVTELRRFLCGSSFAELVPKPGIYNVWKDLFDRL